MKVVKPITIGNAALAASSIPEPDASFGEVVWTDTNTISTLSSYSTFYRASSLANDGNIYCVGDSGRVLKINSSTGSISYFGSYSGRYRSATLANDGNIYCVGQEVNVLKINIASQSVTTFGNHSGGYYASSLASDGNIYCVGGNVGNVLKINVASQSVATFGSYSEFYQSATLANDGNIYCVGIGGKVLKIDIPTQSISTFSNSASGSTSTLAGDGNIYCVGSSGLVTKINVELQTVSNFGNHTGSYGSSSLGIDGNIYCVGVSGSALKIDIESQSVSLFGSYSGDYYTSSTGLSGDIYCVGSNNQNVIAIRKSSQVNDEVIQTDTHKRYRCVINNRDKPSDGVNKVPQTWVDIGPTNKWAPFDAKISTTLKSNSTYTNAIKDTENLGIGSVSAFGLNNVSSVNIRATSASSGLMFNQTYPIVDTDELSVVGIPPMTDYTINMTFNKSSGGTLEVGAIVPGKVYDLGTLQAGASSDVIDYSKSEYDEFGELVYVQRPIVKYSTYPIVIDRQYSIQASRLLNTLRGIPCVWIGNIGLGQGLVTYGAYERSPMTYNNPSIVELQIKVRGVI